MVVSSLCYVFLLLQSTLVFHPAPWLQQYVVLHQLGWWSFPYLVHFGSVISLSLVVAPSLPEWPFLYRLATSDLMFIPPPCRLFVSVYSATMSASLVDRQLAYIATCSMRGSVCCRHVGGSITILCHGF